jgi:hypothetical protein
MKLELALELALRLVSGFEPLGRVAVSWQDTQCGQTHPIESSHAKSRQVTCHLPDASAGFDASEHETQPEIV